jgi:aryl-alcohol dehydrogenase-like predicted oxidoreductase
MSAAADAGCNFFDTADRYGLLGSHIGASEKFIGKWLEHKPRHQFVIATKCRGPVGSGPNDEGLSRTYIFRAVEASLRRLRTDYIDLYQAHYPDPETSLEETFHAFDEIVKQGKVRYVGCSNFPAWMLCKALWISDKNGWVGIVSVQEHYNLVHRQEFERQLMPLCADQNIGVLAYSPLEGGFLTGKYRQGQPLPSGTRGTLMAHYFTPQNFAVVNNLERLAQVRGVTPAQLALAWVIAKPAITSAIVGVRSLKQLEENLAAANVKLTAEEEAILDEVSSWPDDRIMPPPETKRQAVPKKTSRAG